MNETLMKDNLILCEESQILRRKNKWLQDQLQRLVEVRWSFLKLQSWTEMGSTFLYIQRFRRLKGVNEDAVETVSVLRARAGDLSQRLIRERALRERAHGSSSYVMGMKVLVIEALLCIVIAEDNIL